MTNQPPLPWSLEVVPAHAHKVPILQGLVREIFVTMIPGSDVRQLLDALAVIASQGFTPVPHIAAREFASEADLAACFDEIRRLGLPKALLLAGGASRPAGPYDETMDVLRSPGFARSGLRVIGLAGHPEGNPADPDPRRSLANKLQFLQTVGCEAEIVTQWNFSPENVSHYISGLRAAGLTTGVAVGVAGPASLQTLLKYAKICGVSAATTVLKKQGFNLGRLLMTNKPDSFVAAVQGASRFHLYPFGGLERCAQWLAAQHASAAMTSPA